MPYLLSIYLMTLPLITSASNVSSGTGSWQERMTARAEESVRFYFRSSDREVEVIHLDKITALSSKSEYLVELQARAQSPSSADMIDYHCGVIMQPDYGMDWESRFTDCEALSSRER